MYRKILFAALPTLFALSLFAQDDKAQQFIVHFSLGPNWDQSLSPQDQDGFADHSANMQQLRRQGTTLFGARYQDLGMLIIQSDSIENAEQILMDDPAVLTGIFNYSIAPLNVFYTWQQPAVSTEN